ncbi:MULTISPECIES: small acid-soluble spore protein SspI [Paenibacillus]|uniref:small acid-soluble spore protein SspI n=1 Tax=Paenibacillus TaxID=44249 RepID=UPI00020D7D5E|nr:MULTISPECIES: small acid-soluble spore protein SspI [Paenibacillus]EGL18517.1 small, acid-soluble spore protein I [Paenibacillus sp. HGF7]EPD89555.1 small, acid-soluble spore protein I [Paenibacillus sp. HGH0039]MEC0248632.1 small acid-soluble spore protein SspI [Paenibacillus chitinolyticus]
MILSLRQAIVQRVEGKSNDELKEIIDDSIDGQEQALPGLGVLFEVIWKNIDSEKQSELVSALHDHLT